MLDFACKQFDIKDVIKCALGLSRAEFSLVGFLLGNDEWITAEEMARSLKLDVSTVQRGLKKLTQKEVVQRRQNNLEQGGYVFFYKLKDKKVLRKIILNIVEKWKQRVEKEVSLW